MHSSPCPFTHPSVWEGATMAAHDDWLVTLTEAEIRELDDLTAGVDPEADLLTLDRRALPLPRLAPRLRELRREVLHGRGFVQIRGLPVAQLGRRRAAVALWAIGRHVGDEFASQNARGHVLGHVTDTGESRKDPDQRGPYSAERIPYHVDCCDIVALLCLHPARSGGESSIASSGAIHNALLSREPRLVPPLYEPVYRDRRGEVPPGLPPWYAIPIFNLHRELLSVSIEPTYIGSVGRHFDGGDPNTPAQREGVEYVQALADELRLDIEFRQGDIQLVHNHALMHSRQAFVDHPEPRRRRHLLRLWMLNHDARPLPEAYYRRHGAPAEVVRPGGIVGTDTRLTASLASLAD